MPSKEVMKIDQKKRMFLNGSGEILGGKKRQMKEEKNLDNEI